MALALTVFAAGLAVSLWPARDRAQAVGPMPVAWGGGVLPPGASAWVGPLSVLAIVVAMYAFSALAFELMRGLPITAAGGGGH
jgi:cytochrome c oxidase subunit 1